MLKYTIFSQDSVPGIKALPSSEPKPSTSSSCHSTEDEQFSVVQQGMVPGAGGLPQIKYGVEYVFMQNGKQVKKMPIEIDGEAIWVECVGGGQPKKHDNNIIYGGKYIFMENGKQVMKRPIEVDGQAIWVECDEQQRQGKSY